VTTLSRRPPPSMPRTDYLLKTGVRERGQVQGSGSEPVVVNQRQDLPLLSAMARQARLIVPDVAAHIIQRGNNRVACFRGIGDYLAYLTFLRELSGKYECRLHTYCLMPNHVHLLMTPPSAEACAGMMREIGQRYARYFNRRYARTGTLWEGRFRSCVTDSARYVLACYRYIELNPVRAGLASRPESYEWSSHGINMGQRANVFLSPHAEFVALGTTTEARIQAYTELIEQALDPAMVGAIRKATNSGHRLGTEQLP
jgi:putative transposase